MKVREIIIISIITTLIAITGLFQTLVYAVKTPPGFVYPLVHNYQQDFFWYLSLMRQGFDGSLSVTSHYTPEQFAPQPVNTFFPVAGMIGRISGINLPLIYTILRIFGGAGLLFMGYMLLKELKLSNWQRIMAFFFIISGAPFWFRENGILRQAGEFWTGFDPVLRVAWLPHHTLSNALLIMAMILLGRGLTDKQLKSNRDFSLPAAGITVSVAGLLNPASIITFGIAAFVAAVTGLLQRGVKAAIGINSLKGLFYLLAAPAITVFFLYRVQNSVFPWTAFRDWERFMQYPIDAVGFLGVTGLTGILGMIGIPLALVKKKMLWNMVMGWFIVPFFGLILFTKWLPLSNGRFLQSAGYIPAAILASEAVRLIAEKTGKRKNITIITVIAIITVINFPSFISSIHRQLSYIDKNMNHTQVMVAKDNWDAMVYLGKQKTGGIIAAPADISSMIPAFSSYRVLTGHPTFTYQAGEKNRDLDTLYWSDDTVKVGQVISKYSVSAVWAPLWTAHPEIFGNLGFKPVYTNATVKILGRSL